MKILVCVPTYNEAENIEPFVRAVFTASPGCVDVIVTDDNSPDGTAEIVERLMPEYPDRLRLVKRPGKQGGASAFLQSFEWGMTRGYDAMLAMDADFSHDPKYIPAMLAMAEQYDVVIGSRLVQGGMIENRSLARNLVSRGASWYCRLLLGCPIKDWTGGYNLWSKNALAKIGVASIFTRGYSFQIEMKYKAFRAGCRFVEIPIVFPDRKRGVSKMPASFFIKALLDVWRIKTAGMKNSVWGQALRFAVTGGLGTVTNLALFFLCADIAGLPAQPVSIGCFVAAGTQNYLLHHKWSFAEVTAGEKPSLKKWLLFLCSSLFGLAINLAVMSGMLRTFILPYKVIAQACGILAGMVVNFAASKLFVFRSKNHD